VDTPVKSTANIRVHWVQALATARCIQLSLSVKIPPSF